MPRTKASLLKNLTTADLKRLLVARERIDALEKEQAQLTKALAAVEKELARLMAEATGAPQKAPARGKTTRAAAVAKKASGRKAVRGKGAARKAATKKSASRKKSPGKVSRAASGKVTLEDVVAAVIGKQKGPVAFKDLYAAIVKGKLFHSKSSNFDNVLRRTLSTSTKIKRVGRGLYEVA